MQVRIRPNNSGLERFRRGGVEFGRHWSTVDPDQVTDEQLSAIVNEPLLEVDDEDAGEGAAVAGKPKTKKGKG